MKDIRVQRVISDNRRAHIPPEFLAAVGLQCGDMAAMYCKDGEIRILNPDTPDARGCLLRKVGKERGINIPRDFLAAISVREFDLVEIWVEGDEIHLRNPQLACGHCGEEVHGGADHRGVPVCARCLWELRGLGNPESTTEIPIKE